MSEILNEFINLLIKSYHLITENFNNRELAIGFWIIIIVVYSCTIENIRKQIPVLVRIIFSKHLFFWYITMIVYFLVMIFMLEKVGFWEISLLKGTVLWALGAVVASARAIGKAKDNSYFVNLIKDNIKIFIVFQFVVNMYSFSFLVEVVIIFIITVLSILVAILENRTDFQNQNGEILKKTFNIIIAIIGFYSLYYSFKMIVLNINEVDITKNFKDMILPSILSLIFIIYIYFLVLYEAYLQVFFRLNQKKNIEKKYRRILKLKIIILCNIRLKKINSFLDKSKVLSSHVKSKDDLKAILYNFRKKII